MSLKVSIDLWGTLIKGTPLFQERKIELVKSYFPDASSEFIVKCFDDSKRQLNELIENTGMQPTHKQLFSFLFCKINGGYNKFTFIDELIGAYQSLALELPPSIYSEETIKYLSLLNGACSLCISSNTLFITGETLRQVCFQLGISPFITAYKFSDELGVAKPNKRMYGDSIYHIGDNDTTDGKGAMLNGKYSVIINSNSNTIKDAYNLILQG